MANIFEALGSAPFFKRLPLVLKSKVKKYEVYRTIIDDRTYESVPDNIAEELHQVCMYLREEGCEVGEYDIINISPSKELFVEKLSSKVYLCTLRSSSPEECVVCAREKSQQ
jgi:hypothetical protein